MLTGACNPMLCPIHGGLPIQVVASDNMHGHTLAWMRRHVSGSDHVFIADMTGAEVRAQTNAATCSTLRASVH